MSQPLDNATKAGAGAVLGLILAGLAAGGGAYLVASGGWTPSEAAAGHVVMGWGTCTNLDGGGTSCSCAPGAWIQSPGPDGGGAQCVAPVGAVVLHATARVGDSTAAAFGVVPSSSICSAATLPDGGAEHCDYYFCNVTAPPLDGGSDPGPNFIPGATIVFDADQVDSPAPAGAPRFECFRQGRTDAPFTCACAVDATCLQPDGGPAPSRDSLGHVRTLNPGEWVFGPGCIPKSCQEMGGSPSWDSRCAP